MRRPSNWSLVGGRHWPRVPHFRLRNRSDRRPGGLHHNCGGTLSLGRGDRELARHPWSSVKGRGRGPDVIGTALKCGATQTFATRPLSRRVWESPIGSGQSDSLPRPPARGWSLDRPLAGTSQGSGGAVLGWRGRSEMEVFPDAPEPGLEPHMRHSKPTHPPTARKRTNIPTASTLWTMSAPQPIQTALSIVTATFGPLHASAQVDAAAPTVTAIALTVQVCT